MITKICAKEGIERPIEEFGRDVHQADGYCSSCKECRKVPLEGRQQYYSSHKPKILEYNRQWRLRQQQRDMRLFKLKDMIRSAKNRAKQEGVPCDIETDDFVETIYTLDTCPVFPWIILAWGNIGRQKRESPTLDRIVPALGYVKGNVRIISWRANSAKRNWTIRQFIAIGRDHYRIHYENMSSV
jgi:hypothetical protein